MQDPSRAPFDFIADQAETDAQAGLFGVYLSAIDYDDQYHTLMDSIAAYRQHSFGYDEGVLLITKATNYQKAQEVAEDLHQLILRLGSIDEFQQRHALQLNSEMIQKIQIAQDYRNFADYYRDYDVNIIAWCDANGVEVEVDREDLLDDPELEDEIFINLFDNEQYDQLDQLRAALKIGKFAFVHPTPETQC
jgi:hypothetical protein